MGGGGVAEKTTNAKGKFYSWLQHTTWNISYTSEYMAYICCTMYISSTGTLYMDRWYIKSYSMYIYLYIYIYDMPLGALRLWPERQINGNCMQIALRERHTTLTLALTLAGECVLWSKSKSRWRQNNRWHLLVFLFYFFSFFKLLYVCVELRISERVLTERRCRGW